jgi:hypothetical protein
MRRGYRRNVTLLRRAGWWIISAHWLQSRPVAGSAPLTQQTLQMGETACISQLLDFGQQVPRRAETVGPTFRQVILEPYRRS